MKTSSQKMKFESILISEQAFEIENRDVHFDEQTKIREIFRQVEAPAKCWTHRLKIKCSDRYFQMLMSGEREIPNALIPQIKKIAVQMLIEKQVRINSVINELLIASYGPAADPMLSGDIY